MTAGSADSLNSILGQHYNRLESVVASPFVKSAAAVGKRQRSQKQFSDELPSFASCILPVAHAIMLHGMSYCILLVGLNE